MSLHFYSLNVSSFHKTFFCFTGDMGRISIDTSKMSSAKGLGFAFSRRRKPAWYLARPRLLTTIVFFLGLYLWLKFCETQAVVPANSYAFLEDESLRDILNTTLGVGLSYICSCR